MSEAKKNQAQHAEIRITIRNQRGLHARAAAKFVETARQFSAAVTVTRDGETVDGDSILELLTLAAAKGAQLTITARGREAAEALDALKRLIKDKFGERN